MATPRFDHKLVALLTARLDIDAAWTWRRSLATISGSQPTTVPRVKARTQGSPCRKAWGGGWIVLEVKVLGVLDDGNIALHSLSSSLGSDMTCHQAIRLGGCLQVQVLILRECRRSCGEGEGQ